MTTETYYRCIDDTYDPSSINVYTLDEFIAMCEQALDFTPTLRDVNNDGTLCELREGINGYSDWHVVLEPLTLADAIDLGLADEE